ncbi:hypothetical protein [Almyronema epifaneia]|uniref:Uncharacterized protein n=1 Tax=Almyronema epifaneia S1 TaxID=2991925 RepID=A0ABW6IF94_9CYAN
MQKQRPWFWKIAALQQGPNYYFSATFAPHQAQMLAEQVRQHLPAGFVYYPEGGHSQPDKLYASYLDQATYNHLMALQQGAKPSNLWFTGTIEVQDHNLYICNALAGREYGETDLIQAIARSPELIWQQWQVSYGGEGYADGVAAAGTRAAELLAYLRAAPDSE